MLNKTQYIKKFAAACMLIVFAISITPTIVFHNWFAHHTDTYKKPANSKTPQIGKQTFNCHCDNIVAESPFTGPETINTSIHLQFFRIQQAVDIHSLPASPSAFCSLRGPPVV